MVGFGLPYPTKPHLTLKLSIEIGVHVHGKYFGVHMENILAYKVTFNYTKKIGVHKFTCD